MAVSNIVLDKTSVGKYWTPTGWVDDDTAVRRRIAHFTSMHPSDI